MMEDDAGFVGWKLLKLWKLVLGMTNHCAVKTVLITVHYIRPNAPSSSGKLDFLIQILKHDGKEYKKPFHVLRYLNRKVLSWCGAK